MGNKSKSLAILVFALIIVSSLLLVKPSNAQTIPKPSVPQFSLKYVDKSYDVPTTTTIDPYTGRTIINQGYHVNNITFVVIIQNQPLVYQYNVNGSYYNFFYNIQVKGHYAENWSQAFLNSAQPLANVSSPQTSITLGTLKDQGLTIDTPGRQEIIPSGGKEDFQVQGMIGGFFKQGFGGWSFTGQSSDWSPTQTISIPEINSSPSPTPTISAIASPTVPEFSSLSILLLLMVLPFVAVIIRQRKNYKTM